MDTGMFDRPEQIRSGDGSLPAEDDSLLRQPEDTDVDDPDTVEPGQTHDDADTIEYTGDPDGAGVAYDPRDDSDTGGPEGTGLAYDQRDDADTIERTDGAGAAYDPRHLR